MRQRIRLTESKLRNIINECIKQYLTELDWKTYANASRERAKRDGRDSEHTFNYDRAVITKLKLGQNAIEN
jgi:meiotically up-regulated gene 157 (Mug157) protein